MRIPIAIAFTPSYFVPAATMLRSLLRSSGSSFRVICLVTEEIPDRMKAKLSEMGGVRLAFEYIPLKGRLEGIYTDPRYTEAASFRLLLPELLPDLDAVAYIDCDVIVRQDIGNLFIETDLGDNYLAAVFEAPIEKQAERIASLGCDPRRYFNSGFLIMNLRQMREESVTGRLLDACRVSYLEFPDQDALNQVCKGRVLALSPLHNGIRTFFIPKYKPEFERQYSQSLWREVQDHGTIHYTGGKPWNLYSVKFAQWWETYDTLPEAIKAEWEAPSKMKRLWNIHKIKPLGRILESFRALKQKLG